MTTRREFLRGGVLWGAALPLVPFARALRDHRGRLAEGERHLVIVRLEGGNDGLNTLIPFADDAYHRARPRLRIGEGFVKLDDRLALHPALGPCKALFDEGLLGIVPGVGYPQPDRSHFRSMEIWETARPGRVDTSTGWLGRALDVRGARGPAALALGGTALPLGLLSRASQSLVVDEVADFSWTADEARGLVPLLREIHHEARSGAAAEVARQGRLMLQVIEKLAEHGGARATGPAPRRGSLGWRLAGVAQLMRAGLGAHIYHVTLAGFDTHARQNDVHGSLLEELAAALTGFWQDLRRDGLDRRTVVFVFSEFGRRLRENGSLGTDHGAAAPVFLLGASLRGGIVGRQPSLTDLDQGDLKFTTDFRSVYAALLEDWLGVPADRVLDESWKPARVFT